MAEDFLEFNTHQFARKNGGYMVYKNDDAIRLKHMEERSTKNSDTENVIPFLNQCKTGNSFSVFILLIQLLIYFISEMFI